MLKKLIQLRQFKHEKKLSYRDKLLELAYIYNVKEYKIIQKKKRFNDRSNKLILKKNKIIIQKILIQISLKKTLQNRFQN